MTWRNIKLIYFREIRDQLRDRRTLFMIAVLPLLMYPLIGMSVFQLSQFLRQNESRVLLIGSDEVTGGANLPPLVVDGRFAADLFAEPDEARRLILEIAPATTDEAAVLAAAQARLKSGELQVVVRFPVGFGERLAELREATWIAGCDRCRGHLLMMCADAGFDPRIGYSSDDMVVMQALVSAGLGVTTQSGLAMRAHHVEGVVAIELGADHPLSRFRPEPAHGPIPTPGAGADPSPPLPSRCPPVPSSEGTSPAPAPSR